MKTLKVIFNLTALAFFLFSCSESNPKYSTNELGHYIFVHEYIDGSENMRNTKVIIENHIIDVLGKDHDFILSLIEKSLEEAKYSLKYPRTFKLPERSRGLSIMHDPDDESESDQFYSVSVSAIGENAYGVEDQVSTYAQFDIDGNLIRSF